MNESSHMYLPFFFKSPHKLMHRISFPVICLILTYFSVVEIWLALWLVLNSKAE